MVNLVPPGLLKPHPKNSEYYDDVSPEKREEIKQSIRAHGIRDPIKITPDYTILAGHLRHSIALELGLETVPVDIIDVAGQEAEYLLIADNDERRQGDDNPIKKARRAQFLKEYWNVRQGKKPQNAVESSGKNIKDIARVLGESVDSLQRLLKLNNLIPELQALVESGKLGPTAAYSLAFMPLEEQKHLLNVLGEAGVCDLSTTQAKELRAALDEERARLDANRTLIESLEQKRQDAEDSGDVAATEKLLTELDRLKAENELLKARQPEVVEKVVEKVVHVPDPDLLLERDAARAEAKKLLDELEQLESRTQFIAEERERDRARAKKLAEDLDRAQRMLESAQKELHKREKSPAAKENVDFRAGMKKAGDLAAELADNLKVLVDNYADNLVSAARNSGTVHMDLKELADVMADTVSFNFFKLGLEMVLMRIEQIYSVLEEKPSLRVLKGGMLDETT